MAVLLSLWSPYAVVALAVAGGCAALLQWWRSQAAWRGTISRLERERQELVERQEQERGFLQGELRRAAEARDAAEARFRGTFEQAAVGMSYVSLDGRFLRVNQRYCEVTGYSRGELLEMTIDAITHPDDIAADREHLERLRSGAETAAAWEKRYVRKNGVIIWAALNVTAVRSADGDTQYLFAVSEDITARVAAERALRQSEERFRQLVEHAPYGIVVEAGLEFLYVNPAAARMMGADSAARLVGTSMIDRTHPDERATQRERSAMVASGNTVSLVSRRLLRLNGEVFAAEISGTPIVYDGRPAALAFLRDITAQKQAEEERGRLELRLRHAQKMESVGRLAGGVAHDFNNHLTVINGYCDMLLDELGADDPLRVEIGEIRAAGQRAASLTQQLLTFSRKQVVELRPINLNAVVEEHCRMIRRLIGDDIEVVTDQEPNLGAVMADRGQMQQVLMNLAVNARDAMPAGGKIIIATANAVIGDGAEGSGQDVKPGPYVVLTVSDSGVGMAPEILSRIFEPFFTTKSMGVGTGLGLATVYGIVEQAGGFLRVSSEPGNGTIFRVYLPQTASAQEPLREAAAGRRAARGSETILVVEDQDEVRRLAISILKRNGYRVVEAANGADALSLADTCTDPIDLLITDVVMPGMTGRELATRLSASRERLKVLYMSGYAADVIAKQGVIDAGMAYLPKPFAPAELAAKVREVLGEPEPRRRILVIDDDPAVRNCVAETLVRAGFEVLPAADGGAGLGLVESHHVDLVITDLVMPEREGLETVKLLRERFPAVRVIAMSGAFEGEYLKAAARMGAQATFLKPVDTGRLLAAVREMLL
jgi:two-component system, cell cycle sensor histidine kinase and response regulator CckA